MVVVLSAALLFDLIGFAVHFLWIVAIVILALGLGYVVANVRQDRKEAIDRDQEDAEEPSEPPNEAPSAAPAKRIRTRVPRPKPKQS
jgi:flagellar biosynthesis/type III secretory pathway M-ring protein FliF/YscJ